MADQFSLAVVAFMEQLRTLSETYFPEASGKQAGWQVSENELTPMEGGDYFAILRPGIFVNKVQSDMQENEWHVILILYMRFNEYDSLWPNYRAYRGAILDLPVTSPLRKHGIYRQTFAAKEEAGYVVDKKSGNYTDLVAQALDVTIYQRVKTR